MRAIVFLVLLFFGLLVFSVAAQNQVNRRGPTLEKASQGHSLDGLPQWRIDVIQRMKAIDSTSQWAYKCMLPQCGCTVFNHVLWCTYIGAVWNDCWTHVFEPCVREEVID